MTKTNTRQSIKKHKKSTYVFFAFTAIFTLISLVFTIWWVKDLFIVKDIYIYGNQQLKSDDIRTIIKIKKGDKLFGFSLSELYKRLKTYPWIKEAEVRRELTGLLHIKIKEATPIAILNLKDKYYLIDIDGVILEEFSDTRAIFLPLFRDIDPSRHNPAYKEALAFVRFINEKKLFSNAGSIQIFGHRPEDLSMRIDNLTIKIGAGDFEKKLSRLDFVRQEMIKRNIPADTIDLRFSNKIIVKPNENIENAKKKATR
ncbi:MAG: FtsQ-type POTRA domain-containing protein [Thermodesulfovibrionales bacterium]|nr:FtsQ-type POTRA domain-containing protein [Thermodesulfovibrionales bacterium]